MDIKHLHLPTARVIHDGLLETPFWGVPTATIDWCEESRLHPIQSLLLSILDTKVADTLWE
jgi:hypothetical protein